MPGPHVETSLPVSVSCRGGFIFPLVKSDRTTDTVFSIARPVFVGNDSHDRPVRCSLGLISNEPSDSLADKSVTPL